VSVRHWAGSLRVAVVTVTWFSVSPFRFISYSPPRHLPRLIINRGGGLLHTTPQGRSLQPFAVGIHDQYPGPCSTGRSCRPWVFLATYWLTRSLPLHMLHQESHWTDLYEIWYRHMPLEATPNFPTLSNTSTTHALFFKRKWRQRYFI
jgi:hypothetical protein